MVALTQPVSRQFEGPSPEAPPKTMGIAGVMIENVFVLVMPMPAVWAGDAALPLVVNAFVGVANAASVNDNPVAGAHPIGPLNVVPTGIVMVMLVPVPAEAA